MEIEELRKHAKEITNSLKKEGTRLKMRKCYV